MRVIKWAKRENESDSSEKLETLQKMEEDKALVDSRKVAKEKFISNALI